MQSTLISITNIRDPLLIPAFRIYAEAFPLDEQMSTAFWLETLSKLPSETNHLHVVTGEIEVPGEPSTSSVLGMAYHELKYNDANEPIAALWYLCTRVDIRGKSIGSQAYRFLIEKFFACGVKAFVFEVEIPEVASEHDSKKATLAARRIGFYRRLGAKVLGGVNYFQATDNGSAPIPMNIMVQTPNPVSPQEALSFANVAFTNIQESGTLSLD